MAKNTTIKTEGKTLDTIRKELEGKVDQYNMSEDAPERASLKVDMKKLADDWNKTSLLTVYADCMSKEQPLVAFGVAYNYPTISVKEASHDKMVDGVKTSVFTCTIEDGYKQMSLTKFLAWAKEGNHNVAASKDWADHWTAAHNEAKAQWKRFFASKGETTELKIGQMKKKLQSLFDSLVFIAAEGGSDKNAMVATGDMAKYILGLANLRKVDTKTKTQKIQSMSTQTWEAVAMDVWHQVCAKKSYEVIIGDEKPEEDKTAEAKPADKKPGEAKPKK